MSLNLPKPARVHRVGRLCASAALICACLWLAGCRTPRSYEPAVRPTEAPRTAWRQVHTSDASLRRILHIGAHGVSKDRHGLLHVEVPVRNAGPSVLQLQAQVVFLGEAGLETNDETVRRFITVPEDGAVEIQARARTSSATDYRVYLWKAER